MAASAGVGDAVAEVCNAAAVVAVAEEDVDDLGLLHGTGTLLR